MKPSNEETMVREPLCAHSDLWNQLIKKPWLGIIMCAQWSMKPSNKLGAKQKIWSSPLVWGALFVGKDATFPNHCHVSPFSATSLLRPRGWCWWCRFSNPLCPVLLFFFRWPLNSCCINCVWIYDQVFITDIKYLYSGKNGFVLVEEWLLGCFAGVPGFRNHAGEPVRTRISGGLRQRYKKYMSLYIFHY